MTRVILASALLVLSSFVMGCGGGNDLHCASGEAACNGACIDVTNNHANCGACGSACSADLVCGNGACSDSCPMGQMVCDNTCFDTMNDVNNCGACGTMCATDQECRAGTCAVKCAVMLQNGKEDPWGASWDGLERTPATLDVADQTCASIHGRLPTSAELVRVSANKSGAVGEAFNTNPLWTETPATRTDQVTVRLSDAVPGTAVANTPQPYRCVCPGVEQPYFAGNHCNGQPGSQCFRVGQNNIDSEDRPSVRKSAAIRECALEHAHLADYWQLVAAAQAGVGGSNAYLQTADQAAYPWTTLMKWQTGTAWVASGNTSYAATTTIEPFRCIGPAFAPGTFPNAVPNEFVGTHSAYKGERVDSAAALWPDAQDVCYQRGGHLARTTELAELVGEGLPGGSGAWLWTADQAGYNGAQFLAEEFMWTGLDERLPYEYSTDITWDYKTAAAKPFRCVYYPLIDNYAPPVICHGNCFQLTLPGATPAKIWFDSTDRTAATLAAAFNTCHSEGGMLPSERDYTEAIRNSLPNGTNAVLWTSDPASDTTSGANNVQVVYWSAINVNFTDQWSTFMTWVGNASSYAYRCMWTNELR